MLSTDISAYFFPFYRESHSIVVISKQSIRSDATWVHINKLREGAGEDIVICKEICLHISDRVGNAHYPSFLEV